MDWSEFVQVVAFILIFVALAGAVLVCWPDRHARRRRRALLDLDQANAAPAEEVGLQIVQPAVRVDGEPVEPEPIRSTGAVVPDAVRQAQADRKERMLRERLDDEGW